MLNNSVKSGQQIFHIHRLEQTKNKTYYSAVIAEHAGKFLIEQFCRNTVSLISLAYTNGGLPELWLDLPLGQSGHVYSLQENCVVFG